MVTECLDCLIGAAHVAVPIEAVERLVEYEVGAAPPLSQPWVGGIGFLPDQLFVSVRLRPLPVSRPRRETKGLLIRTTPGRPRWAIEVDRIVGSFAFDLAHDVSPLGAFTEIPSGWLATATRVDGTGLTWLDPRAVEAALGPVAGAAA
jgi:hypothetical protein